MRIEFLKEIIQSIIGEKSKGVVELLSEKKNVNEFIIAKKLSLTINQTRNLLYKLLDEGLVTVVRKKNKKKGGWYDHFWTLNLERALQKFKENLEKKKEQKQNEIQIRKKERYYHCETCNIELMEEQALLQEYTCVECGQILTIKDSTKDIQSLEKEITHFQQDLLEVQQELDIISKKEEKQKQKRLKKEAIEKERERKKKKRERKKKKTVAKKTKPKGKKRKKPKR